MKSLLIISFIFSFYFSNATTYYFSVDGSDANNGTSASTPWQTIAKFNSVFSSKSPGDNFLFKRGDVFYGSMVISRSGSSAMPITVGAFGNGANPVITGFTNVVAWTKKGNNVWESTIAVSTLPYTNLVAIGGNNTPMGRAPNTGSFYEYQSHSSSGINQITSNNLNSSVTNWTGAEAAISITSFRVVRNPITAQNGGTITYTPDPEGAGFQNNSGNFIIQNDIRTLDQNGEWYYNPATHKLSVYNISSAPTSVQIPTVDTLLYIKNSNYITVENIDFIGANTNLVTINNSTNLTVNNCNFRFSGIDGVFARMGASPYITFNGCLFSDINSNALDLYKGTCSYANISNNTVKRCGLIFGQIDRNDGGNGANTAQGICARGPNTTISNNRIDSIGFCGIHFLLSNTLVSNNYVTNYCQTFNDGGGIYTVNNGTNTAQSNVQVLNNICDNFGNNQNVNNADYGIYLDDYSNNILVKGNTVSNNSWGIEVHNSFNVTLDGNTAYNNSMGSVYTIVDNSGGVSGYATDNSNLVFKNNIFFAKQPLQKTTWFDSRNTFPIPPANFSSDFNIYCRPIDNNGASILTNLNNAQVTNRLLSNWQLFSKSDAHSGMAPLNVNDMSAIRFEYNPASSSKTITLDANYVDVKNVSYNGTIVLQPYSSVVLIRSGALTNKAPRANAGQDQTITLPTNSVTLSGSGNDTDGTIASYKWIKISGPSGYSLVNATSPATSVTGLVQGVYNFQLQVADNNGATGNDTIQVTVNAAPNKLPTANAGQDQTITLPTNSVTLSGSGNDTDGTIASYKWIKISGPSAYSLVNAASPATSVTGLVQGVYNFQLKVADNNGATGNDTIQVTVNAAPNQSPEANAGPDQTITLPINTVLLNGSGNDPDGTISSYSWTQMSGPSTNYIVDATNSSTTLVNLVQGVYKLQLKVTDNNGATGTDIILITVNSAPNTAPVANAGTDQTIILPLSKVTLSGSGIDADGTVSNYSWTEISGPSGYQIENSNSPKTDVTNLVEGIYQFQLKVTDNNGAIGTDVVEVIVNAAPNISPVADAGANQTITLPVNSITLSGSGKDADGTVDNYSWTQLSGPSVSTIKNTNSPTTYVTNLAEGMYEFQLEITDNNGATGTDFVQVIVNAAANIPPVANAGDDQIITLPLNTITLSGSGTDPDGTVANYSWTLISGPANCQIANVNSAITNVTGLVQGLYQFQLLITDNNGAIGTDIVQIKVNASVNVPPIANAGGNQTITLPVNSIILSGSGSDVDGIVTNYLWRQISGPSTYKIINSNSSITEVTGLVPGVYQFQLQVTDNDEATGTDIVSVTVNASVNIPPVSNAGTDQTITLPLNTIALSGTGIDADGSVVRYAWSQISGPASSNIVNADLPVTDVTNLVQGEYEFELEVTDNNGATGIDIVQAIVNPPLNIPPTADAGPDEIITLPANSLVISGSGHDIDGVVISYLWTKISGPSTCTIVNPTIAYTNITGLSQGVYQFQLEVTDDSGARGVDTIQVTVDAATNLAPTANAGSDKTITLPVNFVSVTGSGIDVDGTITRYQWTQISGPSNSRVVNAASAVTDITDLLQGVYQFEFEVTDNNGATGKDTINILVNIANNISPISDAGTDKIITLPTNSVSISGSGTDADGTIATYQWTKISGPSNYAIVNAASAVTAINGLVEGVYQFQLKVTDNDGAIATDIMQITVNAAPNQPPVANAGTDKMITLPTNSVSISGSGTDADGIIASYEWTKISGPSSFAIVNATSASTDIASLVQGTYKFQLKVTDNIGATATDIIKITVNAAPNQPPVADAGSDKTITLPTNSVSISGSGTDADGTIASYQWTKISGPASFTIANAASVVTTINGLVEGVYKFQLRVTDNKGSSSTDVMQVTVNAAPNQPPVANAGSDKTITLPTNSVSISGSGSDADGTIASYQWTKISGPSSYTIVNAASAVTAINGLVEGVYQFQLKVTDNDGAIATDIMQVTVNAAPNQPPVANAGTDKTITLPTNSVSISGSGSDADGTIASYQWTKISGPSSFAIVNAASAVTAINGLVEGVYQFQLKVIDNDGAIATDIMQVTVNAAPNQPPVANAGSDKTITLPTNSVSISGSGTDADGTIASYQWTKISGPASFTIANAASVVTTINGLVEGVYKFQLRVTDNKGSSSTDVMQVTLNAAPNQPPVANAGTDKMITLPTNSVSISGSGSDADGTIASYQWTKISGPSSYTIVNAASAVTAINGLVEGVYQFQLKVTDNDGAIATDIMQVTVNAAPNQPPVANAGTDKTITLPTNSVSISGSGSDADGTIASYQWTKISGPSSFAIVNAASAVTDVNNLAQGVYQFELKVTDNDGAKDRDTMQITVNAAANVPPVANAGLDKIITLPVNMVSLAGSGTDVDGLIISYVWRKISGPSAYNITNASSPVTDVWGLSEGVYKFELKVTDDRGGTGIDTMQIAVNPAANKPPVADARADQTITLPVDNIVLSGSGIDADGTISGYSWRQLSGPSAGTIASATNATTKVNGLIGGNYEFELTVTDNNGAIGKDTVIIVVTEPRLNVSVQTNGVKVYPNPVIDITTVEISASQVYSKLQMVITNVNGQRVYTKEIAPVQNNIKEQVNMSNLIKGMYTITVYFDGKEKQNIKVVKL